VNHLTFGDFSVGDGGMWSEPHDQTSGQGSATTRDNIRTHGDQFTDRAKLSGQYE